MLDFPEVVDAEAIRELDEQVHAYAKGGAMVKKVYPYQIAFNVIPQVDSFGPNGYTGEETKMMLESRKIMGLPDLKVSSTTVRVPVVRAHSVAVNAEFERPVSVEAAKAVPTVTASCAVVADATAAFDGFDYARALEVVEQFFWWFCDDDIELVKRRRASDDAAAASAASPTSSNTRVRVPSAASTQTSSAASPWSAGRARK